MAAAACGDDDGPAPPSDLGVDMSIVDMDGASPDAPNPDGPVPVDGGTDLSGYDAGDFVGELARRFCEPLARAVCATFTECGCEDWYSPGPARCVEERTSSCLVTLGRELSSLLATGILRLDTEQLAACGAAIEARGRTCTPLTETEFYLSCARAFVDAAPLGAPCATPSEQGFACAGGAGSCASGICRPLAGEGAACGGPDSGRAEPCAPGLVCGARGVCRTPAAVGEACDGSLDCTPRAVCAGGVCREARIAVGGACTQDDACVVGARCIEGTCRPRSTRECDDAGSCGAVELCREEGEYRCVNRRPLGEPCEPGGCVAGATCDFSGSPDFGMGVCVPLPGAGEPCTGECSEGHFCSFDFARPDFMGTCLPLGDEGAPCEASVPGEPSFLCRPDLVCIEGRCAPPPGPGAPCDRVGRCADGLVCRFFDTVYLCADPVPPGGACTGGLAGDCTPDHDCDFRTSTCVPRPGPGEPCEFGRCLPGLQCIADDPASPSPPICRPLPALGERCDWSFECADEAYCAFVAVGGRCSPAVCGTIPDYAAVSIDPGFGPGPVPPPRPMPFALPRGRP
jgi:hypothetical protein